jgi:transposase
MSDGDETEAAIACFSQLPETQIQSIDAIAMDMSPANFNAAKPVIPLAETKIVHDIFHFVQLANRAVERMRQSNHRNLLRDGDEQLKGSKSLWLTS